MQEIERRRSIRKFENREIPREILEKILTAGIKAPSAKNRQPWKFIVMTGTSKSRAAELMRKGIKQEQETGRLLPNSSIHIADAWHTVGIIEQAPVFIMICNPAGRSPYETLTPEERIFERADVQSVGAAVQNMILEAEFLGVGSLWICNIFFAYEELSEYFKESGEMIAALSLGYAAETPRPRPRRVFSDVVDFME